MTIFTKVAMKFQILLGWPLKLSVLISNPPYFCRLKENFCFKLDEKKEFFKLNKFSHNKVSKIQINKTIGNVTHGVLGIYIPSTHVAHVRYYG